MHEISEKPFILSKKTVEARIGRTWGKAGSNERARVVRYASQWSKSAALGRRRQVKFSAQTRPRKARICLE